MKIEQLKATIPYLLKANVSLLIHGWHGRGKSESVKQFCIENGYMLKDIRLGQVETGDLLGLPEFIKNDKGEKIATNFIMPVWLKETIDYCNNNPKSAAIIFLDEINRARRDVLQAVFQLVLDRKMHTHDLPSNCYVICAANPNTQDYTVTDISDKALMGRFCHIKLEPTKEEWIKYAKDNGYSDDIIDFIVEQPAMLENEKLEEFKLDDIVERSRRNWSALERVLKLNPSEEILRGICFGLIGTESTVAFMKFREREEKPISAEDVIENFSKFKKRVEQYSDHVTGGRLDMLKYTCDKIIDYCKERQKKLTKKEEDNLLSFLKIVPIDLVFDTCRKIYPIEICRPALDKDKELQERIRIAKEGNKLNLNKTIDNKDTVNG